MVLCIHLALDVFLLLVQFMVSVNVSHAVYGSYAFLPPSNTPAFSSANSHIALFTSLAWYDTTGWEHTD